MGGGETPRDKPGHQQGTHPRARRGLSQCEPNQGLIFAQELASVSIILFCLLVATTQPKIDSQPQHHCCSHTFQQP